MTGYPAVRDSYKSSVNTNVVGKTDPNSVDTGDVGNIGLDFADALTPFIEAINAFVFYTGTPVPDNGMGVDGDIYVQTNGGTSLIVWRKNDTLWAVQATIPLGVEYQDGIITGLRTQINTTSLAVEVSRGSWAINNVVYSKASPTYLNYDDPEMGSDRIDSIYADTNGDILYLAGSPSATPVKPTLPSNTIEVDSIYVPAEGTGNPYLFSGGSSVSDGTVTEPDGIITPGAITFDDITYLATFTSPFAYRLNGNVYTPTQTTLQLNAPDAMFTRVDIVYGKNDATYDFVEGVAAYTYTAPSVPPNTLALALIYRYADGTNQIVILDTSGYYPKTGGNIDGDVNITNGFNLNLDASEDSEDTGDVVWRKKVAGNLIEMARLLCGTDAENALFVRFDGYPNPTYEVLHTGNTNLPDFDNGDVDTDGNITYTIPEGKTVVGALITQNVSSVDIIKNAYPTYQDGVIYGFEKLTGGDTQTIKIKIL